jgi:hypothetical protein
VRQSGLRRKRDVCNSNLGRQQGLGIKLLLGTADQHPADGDWGGPACYHPAVAVAPATARGPWPSHYSTLTGVQRVFSSAHTASSVGRRFPVSRGRPRVLGGRGGSGSERAASSRSRVLSLVRGTVRGTVLTGSRRARAAKLLLATKTSAPAGTHRTTRRSICPARAVQG